MKITKSKLRQIIKEELGRVLNEFGPRDIIGGGQQEPQAIAARIASTAVEFHDMVVIGSALVRVSPDLKHAELSMGVGGFAFYSPEGGVGRGCKRTDVSAKDRDFQVGMHRLKRKIDGAGWPDNIQIAGIVEGDPRQFHGESGTTFEFNLGRSEDRDGCNDPPNIRIKR